jgi:hypothetical protein
MIILLLMNVFLSAFIFVLFSGSARAADKPSIVCKGSYESGVAVHKVQLNIFEIDETYEADVIHFAPDKSVSKWRVDLRNRFLLSRVEYYAYDPLRVRILFNSVKFEEKGILIIPRLHRNEAIRIKCDIKNK